MFEFKEFTCRELSEVNEKTIPDMFEMAKREARELATNEIYGVKGQV